MMFGYRMIGTNHPDQAIRFYDAVMATPGRSRIADGNQRRASRGEPGPGPETDHAD